MNVSSFHSIGFPCERGVVAHFGDARYTQSAASFHSIGFPCERGVGVDEEGNSFSALVSIQLVSLSWISDRFHSIGFPCERGVVSDFLDTIDRILLESFHSIGFPCERGELP